MALVACPFCREMFERSEAKQCPVCGMGLRALEDLPLSHDAVSEDGVPTAPESELFPLTYLGRGRGPLVAFAFLGLVLFFLPWIHMTMPETAAITGFHLARKMGWSWGAAVAWVVLVPTVMSRRTILQLRGARVAAAFLAAVPAVTVGILLANPPRSTLIPIRFDYAWPLYATLAVSALAFGWSLALGGRADDIRVARGTSSGQTLH